VRITVIVNARARQSEREVRRLPQLFAAHSLSIEGPLIAKDGRELRRLVKRAVKRGAEAIAIGGGDGSMTLGVRALARRNVVLGVLPLGTGNSFAQTLGLQGDLEQAVDVIAHGRVERVDLGVVNRTYFANFATIGFAADVAAAAPGPLKRLFGALAYVIGALKPFLTARPFTANVRWEDGRMALRTWQIVVASGRFFGFAPLLPDASITDGQLAFFTTSGVSHAEIVRMYLALATGQQLRLPDAHALYAKEIRIRARPRQRLSIAGAPLGFAPARFSIARGALRVFVPSNFPAPGR